MNLLDTLNGWLHLTAAAIAVGGLTFSRLVVFPAVLKLDPDTRLKFGRNVSERLRPVMFTVMTILVLTGLYNLVARIPGKPPLYHALIGVKILLALHVFSVVMLLSVPFGVNPQRDAKRPRLMAGAAISGLIILFLAAYLKRAF